MRINPMTNTQLSTSHFRTSWITFIKAREYRGRVVALPCLKLRHGTNPNDVRMPSVMTAEEICKLLRIHKSTLYRLIQQTKYAISGWHRLSVQLQLMCGYGHRNERFRVESPVSSAQL